VALSACARRGARAVLRLLDGVDMGMGQEGVFGGVARTLGRKAPAGLTLH
jgi:hypothetical protein